MPRTNGRVTTLNLTRDYIIHLQQEREANLRDRERLERDMQSLEELCRSGGGSEEGLAEWRRTRDDPDRPHPPLLPSAVPAEDPYNLQEQQRQHDDNLASIEAFAREEHSNLFHSPSIEDQLQSLHQHQQQQQQLDAQQTHVDDEDDSAAHPVDGNVFGYLGHPAYGHDPSASVSPGQHASGRLPTPGDSVAFLSAIAGEPAYTFDPTTGSMSEDAEERRRERVHREVKERNKAKQARYRAKQKAKVQTLQAENQRFKGGSIEADDDTRPRSGLDAQHPHEQHPHASHDPQQQQQQSPHQQPSEQAALHVPPGRAATDLSHLVLHHDDAMTPEEARMLNSVVDPSLMEGLDEEGNLAALSGMNAVDVGHDLTEYHA